MHLTSKYPQIKPIPVVKVSGQPETGVKTTGVKTRGNGAATKGVTARGPMA